MGHAPERIWLQWHGDADPEIEDGEVSEGDVSWCRDKIFRHDIEYIRADLATPAAGEEAQAAARDIAFRYFHGYPEKAVPKLAAIISRYFAAALKAREAARQITLSPTPDIQEIIDYLDAATYYFSDDDKEALKAASNVLTYGVTGAAAQQKGSESDG